MNKSPDWPADPALFLDLDGTLLEFASEPDAVRVPDRLNTILDKLPAVTAGAVAFVSGRTLEDLDRLLGSGRFPLAAVHGLERRDARGRLTKAAADRTALERVHACLSAVVREYPSSLLEHKGVSLALHYRKCPELEQTLFERVAACLHGLDSELRLMRGNMVLEIKPNDGDKGSAIAAFMREAPFAGRTPVFIGDDVTDEDGFRVVNEMGGVTVKVNSGPSRASHRLSSPEAVMAWLEELVAN